MEQYIRRHINNIYVEYVSIQVINRIPYKKNVHILFYLTIYFNKI